VAVVAGEVAEFASVDLQNLRPRAPQLHALPGELRGKSIRGEAALAARLAGI
jgi:hypothetical protein